MDQLYEANTVTYLEVKEMKNDLHTTFRRVSKKFNTLMSRKH